MNMIAIIMKKIPIVKSTYCFFTPPIIMKINPKNAKNDTSAYIPIFSFGLVVIDEVVVVATTGTVVVMTGLDTEIDDTLVSVVVDILDELDDELDDDELLEDDELEEDDELLELELDELEEEDDDELELVFGITAGGVIVTGVFDTGADDVVLGDIVD